MIRQRRNVCYWQETRLSQRASALSDLIGTSQWRRSVVKYGWSGSVTSSHQTVSDYTLRQWFLNTQQISVPDSKNSFTFHVWHSSFILDGVKLTELSDSSFEWKNVTFRGVKTNSDPSYIFSGGQDPNLPAFTPLGTPIKTGYGSRIVVIFAYFARIDCSPWNSVSMH